MLPEKICNIKYFIILTSIAFPARCIAWTLTFVPFRTTVTCSFITRFRCTHIIKACLGKYVIV